MATQPQAACPICGGDLVQPVRVPSPPRRHVCCHNCGEHDVPAEAIRLIERKFTTTQHRARIAYGVRRVPTATLLTINQVQEIAERVELPDAMERVDNLVLFAGAMEPGAAFGFIGSHMRAVLGCETDEAAMWVRAEAVVCGYFRNLHPVGIFDNLPPAALVMTASGWQRRAELLRNGAGSTHAFMAMRFGDDDLERVFRDHLIPAVAATGFELRPTNGPHQTAGSIDNRMRVEIRTSRFVVCDLTHGNRGAYWEAGFAEGLGRPVFYVCRADVLTSGDREVAPHFDTRQQLIIPWGKDDPAPGMQALKDAIRATLPDVARMED